ncbi:MAG: hypothetical protein ACRDT5_06685, partial [Mycobacterium sp.]
MPNRYIVTARTASRMAQLARSRPPSSVTEMWCGNPRSPVVDGTTMACRIGNRLNRSAETTTHGRVPAQLSPAMVIGLTCSSRFGVTDN